MTFQSSNNITMQRISIGTGLIFSVFGLLISNYYGIYEALIFPLPGLLILVISGLAYLGLKKTVASVGVLCASIGLIFLLARTNPFLKNLKGYGGLISAGATFFTALVALYLGSWRSMLRRPRLNLCFDEKGGRPYITKSIAFGKLDLIVLNGQNIPLYKPGFNSRVKVSNRGKSTAKKVDVKVEKIELFEDGKPKNVQHYHPTTVKWSGEFDWNPVDIVAKSHFFLDLFYSINETKDAIINFNHEFYQGAIYKASLAKILNTVIIPSGQIYWNVWVKEPSVRGMPGRYVHQGHIAIHFVLNAENCNPLRFRAEIDWTPKNWNNPRISVLHNNKSVKEC